MSSSRTSWPLGAGSVECRIHIDRVPEHDGVHPQAACADPSSLAFAIALPLALAAVPAIAQMSGGSMSSESSVMVPPATR